MPCDVTKDSNGVVTRIVCSRGGKPCRFCKSRRADKLCDWKVGSTTCDAPMCSHCALNVAVEKDLCPDHVKAYETWKAKKNG